MTDTDLAEKPRRTVSDQFTAPPFVGIGLGDGAGAPDDILVHDKYTRETIGRVPRATPAAAQELIREGAHAAAAAAQLPRHVRASVLENAASLLERHGEDTARLIVSEAGKTIRQARREVSRAVNTLRLSAHEALRNVGEVVPFDSFPGGEGRRGWFTREPLGLIAAITPYNDALNLVAHKLGPAIAGGNAVILKPADQTPLTARLLVELLRAGGLPDGIVSVVHGDRDVAATIVKAREIRMVSFTGGFATGRAISAIAGIKRLTMELGGNAPVIVFNDADVAKAVEACVSGAFWGAGQNCIGAQRILVERDVYDSFLDGLVAGTRELVVGDPGLDTTDIGPMISADAAQEASAKIDQALELGARVLTGGSRHGALMEPTVLTNVPRTCSLWTDEAFAPVVIVDPFDSEDQAVTEANDSEYALQAGVFTKDIDRALRVAGAIEAGGVMINDSSDYRLDAMPFGGAKYGSMGREGVRFAFEEMTQPKVIAITS